MDGRPAWASWSCCSSWPRSGTSGSYPDRRPGRFLRPFYDPETFSLKAVSTGTSMAMLTYIGFDAISTLSEEAHNPRATSCWRPC